jgi:hypothetical protein
VGAAEAVKGAAGAVAAKSLVFSGPGRAVARGVGSGFGRRNGFLVKVNGSGPGSDGEACCACACACACAQILVAGTAWRESRIDGTARSMLALFHRNTGRLRRAASSWLKGMGVVVPSTTTCGR